MNDIAQKPTTEQPKKQSQQPDSANTDGVKATQGVWGKFWGFFSSRILNLVTLTTFFSVAGYFVVHSYLDKVTGIFTYQIDPVMYITAGVNMMFGVIVGLILQLVPLQPSILIPGLISFPAVGLFAVIVYWLTYRQTKSEERAQQRTDMALKRLQSLGFYMFIGGVAVLATLLGFVYGYYGYEYSPHAIGGGMPSSVVLVFKPQSGIQISDLGLPIEMQPVPVTTGTPAPALRSQPVEILMELSDGILVRDPQQGIPVVIKNDLLYAVIDVEPRPFSPAGSVTPTPSGTPTETPTIAPMPSP